MRVIFCGIATLIILIQSMNVYSGTKTNSQGKHIYYMTESDDESSLYKLELNDIVTKSIILEDISPWTELISVADNKIVYYENELLKEYEVASKKINSLYKCSHCWYYDSNDKMVFFRSSLAYKPFTFKMIKFLGDNLKITNSKERYTYHVPLSLKISPDSKMIAYYLFTYKGTYDLVVQNLTTFSKKTLVTNVHCFTSDLSYQVGPTPPLIWLDNKTALYQNSIGSKGGKVPLQNLIGVNIFTGRKIFTINGPRKKTKYDNNLGLSQYLVRDLKNNIIYDLGKDYYVDISHKRLIERNHIVDQEFLIGSYKMTIVGHDKICTISVFNGGNIIFKEKGLRYYNIFIEEY